jgi:misacylated tRNA(Ala) deacylase
MTETYYLDDSYLKELSAKVKSVEENRVILDKTIFYATGGGQPCDYGIILKGHLEFNITDVKKEEEEVIHYVDGTGLEVGDNVLLKIDWERRYALMKIHTAAHVLAGAMITGGALDLEKCKMDFNVSEWNPEIAQDFVRDANEALKKELDIEVYYLTREELDSKPDLVKLAKGFPKQISKIRIVAIGDYDIQADGGTHVKNTKEVGRINLIKVDNKGKGNKRIYYSIS